MATTVTSNSVRNEFMQLLVQQLKNQDPFEPVKQEQFLGQLAQFSTLEGIENMNANFSDMLRMQQLSGGSNLLGQRVIYPTGDGTGASAQGLVEAVGVENGSVVLVVNGTTVGINEIQGIVAD